MVKDLFNAHSFLASLYRHTNIKNVPNGLCDFVWGLLFGIIMLPFTWLVIVFNLSNKSIEYNEYRKEYSFYGAEKPLSGTLYSLACIVIGAFVVISIDKLSSCGLKAYLNSIDTLLFIGITYVIGILTIAFFIFLIWGIVRLVDVYEKKYPKVHSYETHEYVEPKVKTPSIFVLFWRGIVAYKEKNCPLITWDYTNKKNK